MSRIVKISLWGTAVFHLFFFLYILIIQILRPTNGQITGDGSTLGFDLILIMISGLLVVYALVLLLLKIRSDGWRAGLPLFLSIGMPVVTLFLLPALDSSLHLRFRLNQSAFVQSAEELYPPQSDNELALPEQYQHLTVGGSVMVVNGRLFYLQSIGMMAELGPGYLYDPQNNPTEVCFQSTQIIENWYDCNLK